MEDRCEFCEWDDKPVHDECGGCEDCCPCKPVKVSFKSQKTRRTAKEWKS